MLITLKHSQRKITSVVLSLFMGSWLLLLCQTCLAAMDDIDDHKKPISELSNSCHTHEIDEPIKEKNNVINDHCLGACDCDALTTTFSSEKSLALVGKIKFSPDIYTFVASEIVLSNRAPPGYRIPATPDQAILSPYHRYTVLLI
jgi:hypothetical protein